MSRENFEAVPLNDFNSQYRHIFDTVDTNNDGYICVGELENFIKSSHKKAHMVPRRVVQKIHKMSDENGDKKLDFREFVNMLEQPNLQRFFRQCVIRYVNFIVPIQEQSVPQLIDECKCCPPPIFMFLISVLEVAFHLTDETTEKNSTLNGTGVTAKVFIYDSQRRQEVWRYLTYMFVHIGYTHLLVNLGVQLIIGVPLEAVHKWWRVLVVYFLGVLAGSLAHSITDPRCRLAGASGGVYALLTAHIACIIMNWSELIFPHLQITIYMVIVVCDLGQSIYDRYFLKVQSPVGIAAHLGGAVAGLLVGIYILRNLRWTKTENYIWWVAVVLYIVLMGAAVIINIAWPGYFAGIF